MVGHDPMHVVGLGDNFVMRKKKYIAMSQYLNFATFSKQKSSFIKKNSFAIIRYLL